MTGSAEQKEAAVEAPTTEPKIVTEPTPTSPAPSDKSSDSEGKPVREKLKETRIDAQATSDPVTTSDQPMHDAANGSANLVEQSASGSDSDRGRLRKKRSREDFEDEVEIDKQPEKKQEKDERHHMRKRSRDVKDIESGAPLKPAATPVATIEENVVDEEMTTPRKEPSKAPMTGDSNTSDTSPKNKRTRDQVEDGATTTEESAKDAVANGKPVSTAEDERDSKRPRDEDGSKPAAEASNKITLGSGFANTSTTSPFAAMSPKPQAPKASDRPELLPTTSDDKFKASGFANFAKSNASPLSGFASPGSKSPFAAAGDSKPSSFGGSKSPAPATTGGFASLGGSTKSAFGGSTFGSSLGGGFGALSATKPPVASFGSATPSDLTIKGLKSKATAFGTPGGDKDAEASDEEDDDDDDAEKDSTKEERQSSQPLLSQQPTETGEEGEVTAWTGRAKLYTMAGEGTARAWKERGVGTFKFNVSAEAPRKARFVLRADGTHRLLLNAAVTKQLVFGGDSKGEKPKDGRLLFNSPTSDGELEMHLLKLKAERAVELWEEVSKVQESDL